MNNSNNDNNNSSSNNNNNKDGNDEATLQCSQKRTRYVSTQQRGVPVAPDPLGVRGVHDGL